MFDASKIPVGKMACRIAHYLQGKNKPIYKPYLPIYGDVCVIVNASNMRFTRKKAFQKVMKYHSGYVGHLKQIPYKRMI